MLHFLKHRLYPFICDVIAFVVYPFVRVLGWGNGAVAVLLYHNVSEVVPTKSAPYMNVSPGAFMKQISALRSGRFDILDGNRFLSFLDGKYALSKPGVLITFDDGFRGFYRYALPIIERKEIPVLLFLTTNYTNEGSAFPWLSSLTFVGTDEYPESWFPLKYEQLKDSEYVTMGGHGASHRKIGSMPSEEARAEISRCYEALIDLYGVSPAFFAYPQGIAEYGDWTSQSNEQVREYGFKAAFNSHVGRVRPGDDRFALRRIAVNEYDSGAILKRKIYGAYDWVYYLQRFIHRILG